MPGSRTRSVAVLLSGILLVLVVAALRVGPLQSAAEAGGSSAATWAAPSATRTRTLTRTPSLTPPPTPTPPTLSCQPLASPVTIDGDLSDWPGDQSTWDYMNAETARVVNGERASQADCSVVFNFLHDDRNVYFAFRVYDDEFVIDYSRPLQFYCSDSVELGLDGVVWDPDDRPYGADDYQFQIRADGAITETIHGQASLEDVVSAVKRVADGYQVELAVPLEKLGHPRPFLAGTMIGLDFTVNDNDSVRHGPPTQCYDTRLFWQTTSTQNSGPGWGRLTLDGDLQWQEVRLQQVSGGYQGTDDTFLSDASLTTPQGTADRLDIRSKLGRGLASPMLRFALPQLPPEAVIVRASLDLYPFSGPSGLPPMAIHAYPVQRRWVESEATWLLASNGHSWQGAGCTGALDRADTPAANRTLAQVGTFWSLDISGLADQWRRGQIANEGLILDSTDPANDRDMTYELASSESTYPLNRPALALRYYVPVPTATLVPTETPTPSLSPTPVQTATPTPTLSPTATSTPTVTPTVPTGAMTVQVCEDLDQDFSCTAADRGLDGAAIEIRRAADQSLWASCITAADGTCVYGAVPVGRYVVSAHNLPGYAWASDDEWTVEIGPGDEVIIPFIAYPVGTPPARSIALPLVQR